MSDFSQSEAARKAINGWVKCQTKEKIDDLIKEGVLNAKTRLVLVNAIYFKGDWATKFDDAKTFDGEFFVDKVKTWRQRKWYKRMSSKWPVFLT